MTGLPPNEMYIIIEIEKEAVERLDLSVIHDTFATLPALKSNARQKVFLSFAGYDDTPEEIYEIPMIRTYVLKVFEVYPYFFYYITHISSMAGYLLACLGDVTVLRRAADSKATARITLDEETARRLCTATFDYAAKIDDSPERVTELLKELPINIKQTHTPRY